MKDARPSIPGIKLGAVRRSAGRLTEYDATDRVTKQPLAVSVIAPGDDDYLELVIGQQRSLEAIDSPHVQRVLRSGVDRNGLGYVVAEPVVGTPLSQFEGTSLELLPQVAAAVRVLHDADLAHGAIDPDRVLVGHDGTVTVTNAGLAGYLDGSASIFQPDEQANRPIPQVTDDVFALGALGWWLQTGRTPDKPGELGAEEHVENALRKALDRDPGGRQWTVEEFLYDIEHAEQEKRHVVVDPAAPAANQLPPAELGARRLPLLIGAGAMIALLIGAFSVFRPDSSDVDTQVLGVTTVPTPSTVSTTLPDDEPTDLDEAVEPDTATQDLATQDLATQDSAAEEPAAASTPVTDGSAAPAAPAPATQTPQQPAATNPAAPTPAPSTQAPAPPPTTAPTGPPTTSRSTIPVPSITITQPTILTPTTRPPTTQTSTTQTSTTQTSTTQTSTTQTSTTTTGAAAPEPEPDPEPTPTAQPNTGRDSTRNSVLPDTPVTGNN